MTKYTMEKYLSDIKWYKGHKNEGQPVMMFDHQVRAVNALLKNQHGIAQVATSGGKCVFYENLINITIENSDFEDFLNENKI